MDMSGFVFLPITCCCGIALPVLLVGLVSAYILDLPEARRPLRLTRNQWIVLLVSAYILIQVAACLTITYLTRDFYIM